MNNIRETSQKIRQSYTKGDSHKVMYQLPKVQAA